MPLRALLCVLSLALAACDVNNPPPVDVGAFEATLTGEVEATLTGSAGALRTAGESGLSIQLLPGGQTTSGISFTGPLDAAATFTVGDFGAEGAASVYRDGDRFLFGTAGTVTVTSASDREVTGTFTVDYAPRAGSTVPTVRAEGTFTAVRL